MNIKSGLRTTEFWLAVAVYVLGWVEEMLHIVLPKEPLYGIIAYILARGWTKANGDKK